MYRIGGMVGAFGVLLLATGCAHNSQVGSGSVRVGVFFGEVGITGYGDTLTIQNGSRVTKLSIIGDNNSVTVEDQVTLPYIQFWGKNNTVSVPEYLLIRVTEAGQNNRVIRRPVLRVSSEEYSSPYAPPPSGKSAPPPTAAPETTPTDRQPALRPVTPEPVENTADTSGETEP